MNFKKCLLMGLSLAMAASVGLSSEDAQARSLRSKRYVRSGYGTQRQANQLVRIRSGLRGGSLTKRESRALYREQRKINRLRKKFMRDGYLSRFERRRLSRLLKRADRNILKMTRNAHYHHRHRLRKPRRKRTVFKRARRPVTII